MEELPLRDIHLPPTISWWPLAFGWWLVIALALLVLICLFFVVRKWMKMTLRKEAFKALAAIEQTYNVDGDPARSISELSRLMRRIIISQDDSEKLAGITGIAWLELLDKKMETLEFSQGKGQLLLNGPYQKTVDKEQVSDLIKLCKKWAQRL
jgi:hypothetical protein